MLAMLTDDSRTDVHVPASNQALYTTACEKYQFAYTYTTQFDSTGGLCTVFVQKADCELGLPIIRWVIECMRSLRTPADL